MTHPALIAAQKRLENLKQALLRQHGPSDSLTALYVNYREGFQECLDMLAPAIEQIYGLLEPISHHDWHGKWRILRAMGAVSEHRATPEFTSSDSRGSLPNRTNKEVTGTAPTNAIGEPAKEDEAVALVRLAMCGEVRDNPKIISYENLAKVMLRALQARYNITEK